MPLIRCRHYNDAGQPIAGGCPKLGQCDWVHPSELKWDSAKICENKVQPRDTSGRPRIRCRRVNDDGSGTCYDKDGDCIYAHPGDALWEASGRWPEDQRDKNRRPEISELLDVLAGHAPANRGRGRGRGRGASAGTTRVPRSYPHALSNDGEADTYAASWNPPPLSAPSVAGAVVTANDHDHGEDDDEQEEGEVRSGDDGDGEKEGEGVDSGKGGGGVEDEGEGEGEGEDEVEGDVNDTANPAAPDAPAMPEEGQWSARDPSPGTWGSAAQDTDTASGWGAAPEAGTWGAASPPSGSGWGAAAGASGKRKGKQKETSALTSLGWGAPPASASRASGSALRTASADQDADIGTDSWGAPSLLQSSSSAAEYMSMDVDDEVPTGAMSARTQSLERASSPVTMDASQSVRSMSALDWLDVSRGAGPSDAGNSSIRFSSDSRSTSVDATLPRGRRTHRTRDSSRRRHPTANLEAKDFYRLFEHATAVQKELRAAEAAHAQTRALGRSKAYEHVGRAAQTILEGQRHGASLSVHALKKRRDALVSDLAAAPPLGTALAEHAAQAERAKAKAGYVDGVRGWVAAAERCAERARGALAKEPVAASDPRLVKTPDGHWAVAPPRPRTPLEADEVDGAQAEHFVRLRRRVEEKAAEMVDTVEESKEGWEERRASLWASEGRMGRLEARVATREDKSGECERAWARAKEADDRCKALEQTSDIRQRLDAIRALLQAQPVQPPRPPTGLIAHKFEQDAIEQNARAARREVQDDASGRRAPLASGTVDRCVRALKTSVYAKIAAPFEAVRTDADAALAPLNDLEHAVDARLRRPLLVIDIFQTAVKGLGLSDTVADEGAAGAGALPRPPGGRAEGAARSFAVQAAMGRAFASGSHAAR